ncbi:MAG: right-handed parallel beta-helix repeat-containing protein, partial [Vicinamibacteraceae bacterium]
GADNARVDGFTIRLGRVRGHGAGILCDHTSPTISNNTIVQNIALEPEGLLEKGMLHQPGNEGGGIACINGCTARITNNIISYNKTGVGGGAGIAVSNWSMPHIYNNVITDNESGVSDANASRSSNGAAISASHAMHREPLRMTVVNNVIANNRTGARSKSDAGGMYLEYDSAPIIAANWILGNWCADDGSGIYVMKSSHPLFAGNIVAGNNSSAIRLSKEGRGDIENNLVFGNAAAVICISSFGTFKNNTIVDNASGVLYGNPYAPHLKPSSFSSSLIYGNGDEQIRTAPNEEPPVVTNNDIQGGYAGGEGNFDEEPQFDRDEIVGRAAAVEYDSETVTTSITPAAGVQPGAALAGRVIQLGDKWSVIKAVDDDRIVVWGDLRAAAEPQPVEFEIAKTYRLRTALARKVGAR